MLSNDDKGNVLGQVLLCFPFVDCDIVMMTQVVFFYVLSLLGVVMIV